MFQSSQLTVFLYIDRFKPLRSKWKRIISFVTYLILFLSIKADSYRLANNNFNFQEINLGLTPLIPRWNNMASYSTPVTVSSTYPTNVETYPFQAEVSRVMDIIINSLYTNKDIFLRELISNAADACDKKKHSSESSLENLEIRIKANKQMKTLTIEDDGIGMNKEEMINNLGTIARSGTAHYIKQISQDSNKLDLIGKFGVGFYSSYLVANQVEVLSKRYGSESSPTLRWVSNSGGSFNISEYDDSNFLTSGTRVILHLKSDLDEYLEDYKIKELLRKYSEFINFPIKVWSERVEYDRVPDSIDETNTSKTPRMKTITKRFYEWDMINKQKPIWRKDPNNIHEDEYQEFYKTTFQAYDNPIGYTHFKVEGQIDFACLLFIPGTLPWELNRNMFDQSSKGIRLYVKRVFINDQFSEAIPRWLTFVRGIVDSDELPLNVGREILQQSRLLTLMNKRIASKSLEMIRKIKIAGGDKWENFWSNYGKYLKVGVVEDRDHQNEIASLIEFYSTNSENRTSLDDYISRMKVNQTNIYYVTAESKKSASELPALEKLKKFGYEILYSTEPIDEFCLSTLSLNKYKNFEVVDVNKADIKLPEDETTTSEALKEKEERFASLCDWIHNELGKKLQKVIITDRLVESPAILVQGDFGLSPTMEKYMKQQAASQGMNENQLLGLNSNQYILEINPDHEIIHYLKELISSEETEELARENLHQLYDVVSLQGGYTISDTNLFAKRVITLMQKDAQRSLRNN